MADTTTMRTHQNQVQVASGFNVLASIWLFISAFAVYAHGPMMTNNIILGIAVGILALFRLGGAYEQGWVSWINVILGMWVIVSPWAVMGTGPNGPTQGMIINNVITGGVITALGLWSALATNTEPGATTYTDTAHPSYGR